MHRLETTVQFRLDQLTASPVGLDTQERWIRQLTSAVVWLERLGYVYGDLQPANAFLDAMEDIKLGDFDATVKKGERLLVASETWFCKLDEDYEAPLAGPVSEQFALGSFFFTPFVLETSPFTSWMSPLGFGKSSRTNIPQPPPMKCLVISSKNAGMALTASSVVLKRASSLDQTSNPEVW